MYRKANVLVHFHVFSNVNLQAILHAQAKALPYNRAHRPDALHDDGGIYLA